MPGVPERPADQRPAEARVGASAGGISLTSSWANRSSSRSTSAWSSDRRPLASSSRAWRRTETSRPWALRPSPVSRTAPPPSASRELTPPQPLQGRRDRLRLLPQLGRQPCRGKRRPLPEPGQEPQLGRRRSAAPAARSSRPTPARPCSPAARPRSAPQPPGEQPVAVGHVDQVARPPPTPRSNGPPGRPRCRRRGGCTRPRLACRSSRWTHGPGPPAPAAPPAARRDSCPGNPASR
jgi:hypothetical protein